MAGEARELDESRHAQTRREPLEQPLVDLPAEYRVLAPLVIREIVYRLLKFRAE